MKKVILIILLVFIVLQGSTQVFISEDFTNYKMPPAGWGTEPVTQNWYCKRTNFSGGTQPEAICSVVTANPAVAYLVSPLLDLTGVSSVTIMFDHCYDYKSMGFGPNIGIATRSNNSEWHSVWELSDTTTIGPELKAIEINNSDLGQNFQFGFYMSGNFGSSHWYIDNIILMATETIDVRLQNVHLLKYIKQNTQTPVTGKFVNLGKDTVRSVEIGYRVDQGQEVNSLITGLDLNMGASYNFTLDTPLSIAECGDHTIQVYVKNVNGASDYNHENDSLSFKVRVVPWVPVKKVLCEECTGTWCGWCVRGICYMDYMAEKYHDSFIGVAIHNYDTMTVNELAIALPNILGGPVSYPTGAIDRVITWQIMDFEKGYLMQMDSLSPGSVQIVNFEWNPGIRKVAFDVQSEFIDDNNHELRLNAIITEDSCHGTSAQWDQHNYYSAVYYSGDTIPMCGFELLPDPVPASEMYYNFVLRDMLGGPYGTEGSIPSPALAGSVYTYHYEYTIPAEWNYKNLKFIGLLMDQTAKTVLNVNNIVNCVGMKEKDSPLALTIIPNPVKDQVLVNFTGIEGKAVLQVLNLNGQVLVSQNINSDGIVLNISSLPDGLYFVRLRNEKVILTGKFIKQ